MHDLNANLGGTYGPANVKTDDKYLFEKKTGALLQ